MLSLGHGYPDTQQFDSSIEGSASAAITVVNQVAEWFSQNSTGFDHMLLQRLRGGMHSHPHMHEFTSTVVDDKEHIRNSKSDSLNRQEITRPDLVSVQTQELSPAERGPASA